MLNLTPCPAGQIKASGAECGTCSSSIVNACGAIDGCCPAVCSVDNDNDCAGCGNGRVENGETCDGDCESLTDACFENALACQRPMIEGSADSCDVACRYEEITACGLEDGCCPAGCDFTQDFDCEPEPVLHGDACAFDPFYCQEDNDGGFCVTPDIFPPDSGFIVSEDGICTSLNCLNGTPCNNGTVCVALDETGDLSICLRPCNTDNDCQRDDVSCQGPPDGGQSFCF